MGFGALWLVAGGRGTWGVPLRDGSLREKGVGGDPFFPSVRFILAKGLPMHRALLSFVVALGFIAGQDPLQQRPSRRDSRGVPCWSASRGAIDAATNMAGGLWVGSWFA